MTPRFLITIDTEGDNLWSKPRYITTRNARYLPRFQALCENVGFKPTYLTNYEMARAPEMVELGKDILARGTGEIGLHPHAWDSPPIVPLTDDDLRHQPYLIEYPESVVREKIKVLTAILEDTFGRKMVSHRAGRWAMNELYARVLVEHGYLVDCSVTPGVCWRRSKGDPSGTGGSDYALFPEGAYTVSFDDLSRASTPTPDEPRLLELPMTILSRRRAVLDRLPPRLRKVERVRSLVERMMPVQWLRPKRGSRRKLLEVIDQCAAERRPYVEFMLHSSEFMPGGSPNFPSERDIEDLYADLEVLFEHARKTFQGATLEEYAHEYFGSHASFAAAGRVRPDAGSRTDGRGMSAARTDSTRVPAPRPDDSAH